MIPLLITIQAALQPGETNVFDIANGEIKQFDLEYSDTRNAFEVVLETSKANVVLQAFLCDSSISSFDECSKSSQHTVIRSNYRAKISLTQIGTQRLFVTNIGRAGQLHLTYDDAVNLAPGVNFTSNGPAFLRIPVCSDVELFSIQSNVSSVGEILYSFTSGRPQDPLTSFDNLNPQFPGFLYLHVRSTGAFYLSAAQHEVRALTLGDALKTELSAYRGCYRYFTFASQQGQLTAAASEIDNASVYDINLYYRAAFTGDNFATKNSNDGQSQYGLLKTITTAQQSSELSLRTQQDEDYLPLHAKESGHYEMYFIQLYVTFANDGVLPGQMAQFNLTDSALTYVIPFKYTSQATTLAGETHSMYVVQALFDAFDQGIPAFQFGHENPDDNSFLVQRYGQLFQSYTVHSDENDYEGDLFYATILCEAFSCSGQFRAEHSYQLNDRVETLFSHVSGETDEYYYMNYQLKAGGLEFEVFNTKADVKIYLSQTDILPNASSTDKLEYTCFSEQQCRVRVPPGQLLDYKPVYISVQSQQAITVVAAQYGENVVQLFQGKSATTLLYLGENKTQTFEYMFDFNTKDYAGTDITKKYTTLSFEAANVNKNKLPQDLEIVVYASYEIEPGPLNYIQKATLSAGEFIKDADGQNITRLLLRILNNYGGKLYFSVRCEGNGCQNNTVVKTIMYGITPYPVDELTIDKAALRQMQTFALQNGTDINYFMLLDDHIARFSITMPQDGSCANITYRVYVCAGVVPTVATLKSVGDSAYCKQRNLSAGGNAALDFDTTNENVSAGFMYVAVVPDFTLYDGDLSKISKCKGNFVLYDSELISDFHVPVIGELFQSGVTNGLFYAARIPTIAESAATADSSTGDYIAVKVAASQSLQICISDAKDNYYPLPLNRNCINTPTQHQNSQFAVYFRNYKNQPAFLKFVDHTIVYISVYSNENIDQAAPLRFNLTIAPQTLVPVDSEGPMRLFISKQYYGLQQYIGYAFNLSKLTPDQLQQLTVFTGPYCNDSYCRQIELAPEFYGRGIVTSISQDNMLPVDGGEIKSVYNKGVHLMRVADYISNLQPGMLYVTLEYRWQQLLNSQNSSSQIAYYAAAYTDKQTLIGYQRSIVSGGQVIDYHYTTLAYSPTEIVLYPCRGSPALLLDWISPRSKPELRDYQIMLQGEWGHPVSYQLFNNTLMETQQFLSVFDLNAFDFSENHFVKNETEMQYELFVGSQARYYRPGNQGQITVLKYSASGEGKVSVRFAPAAAPNQAKDVAPVNYTLYALPYAGSFNEQSDFSPYTSCGVGHIGRPIYKNQDSEYIPYDSATVSRDGYIEVTSNQPLWPQGAKSGQVVYITVLANQVAYQGVLAANSSISAQLAIGITFIVVIVVIFALLLVFYFVYIRHRRQKVKGYKPMVQ